MTIRKYSCILFSILFIFFSTAPAEELKKNTAWESIGPEGGWADDEVTAAKKAGFFPVKFGHGILRVETAAIGFLSMIKFYFNMTEKASA